MKKKVIKLLSVALSLNIIFPGIASAVEVPVSGPTDWIIFQWTGGDGTTTDDSYRLSQGGLLADVQDGFLSGDVFQVLRDGNSLGFTSASNVGTSGGEDPNTAAGIANYTRGTFDVGPGLLTIVASSSPWGNGSAWIRFRNSPLFSEFLVSESAPTLNVVNGTAACTPGKYKFASGSSVEIQSVIYTLVLNDQRVSQLAFDSVGAISAQMLSPVKQSVSGVATKNSALWNLNGKEDYTAHCEVTVVKSGATFNATSDEYQDATFKSKIAAKAQAWEDQRSAATAANFTKDMREMRKRIAARQP